MKLNSTLLYFTILLFLVSNNIHAQKSLRRANKFKVLDTSVSGIKYNNAISIYDSLLSEKKNNDQNYKRAKSNYSLFELTNTSKTEYVNLNIIPGDDSSRNDSSYTFKVYYGFDKANQSEAGNTKTVHFITENGVYLGMSFKEFSSIYPFIMFDKIHLGEFDIYRFYGDRSMDEMGNITSFNYIALYKFYNNTLVEFLFGKYNRWYNYIKAIMNGNPLYLKYQDTTQY